MQLSTLNILGAYYDNNKHEYILIADQFWAISL